MKSHLTHRQIGIIACAIQRNLAQDAQVYIGYDSRRGVITTRRYLIPIAAFLLGSTLMAGVYFGILSWAQGPAYASSQFLLNHSLLVAIWVGFGIQAALYSILRFGLLIPTTTTGHTGAMMGASGGTSATAMVACCIHHVTDVLPILGLSAAATFLTRYQRPFMLVGLGMETIGILAMLVILYRERQKLYRVQEFKPILEAE